MKRFCPSCGKEIEKGNATFCPDCAKPDFEFAEMNPSYCISCHRILFKNKWIDSPTVEESMQKVAQQSVKAKIKLVDFEMPERAGPGNKIDFTIPIEYHGDAFELPASLFSTVCDRCSKQGTKYFEAVLQIRPANREVISFIMNELKKQQSKGVWITKEEDEGVGKRAMLPDEVVAEKSTGKNIYITNQTYAKVLARKIKDQFGAQVAFHEKLFSQNSQTSKELFRLAVLISLPPFSKTDMLLVKDRHYQVTSVKKKANVTDLETGTKTSLETGADAKRRYAIVPSVSAQVTKIHPTLEVLHPETYQSIRVVNANLLGERRSKLKENDQLVVAFDAEGAWAFL